MAVYLLLAAAVILACIIFNRISHKLGVPVLLAFILLGMFFGSDGVVKIPFDDFSFAGQICSTALIFIMFYGGFGTKWKTAKPVAVQSILLSTLGVIMTAGLTGLFCHIALNIGWLESLLIGSVVSSTDAASVFSILRSKRLNLKDHTASMLEMESGSNDPFAYMLMVLLLSVMTGTATGGDIAYMLFAQIVYGLAFGVIIAASASWVLKRANFGTAGFDAIFVLAVALCAYAVPAALGGNGYLSAYIVGIVLGNRSIKNKQSLVHFFDGVTGLMQMLIFFLLGLLSFPSKLPQVLLPALFIALFLTFVARPLSVFAILSPLKCGRNQQMLVSWAGLRGAASIVFAITAALNTGFVSNDVFSIVFCVVLFSISVQGTLLPLAAKRLHMIDADADVLKTFTDYADEVPVRFIQLKIPAQHPWADKAVRDIQLPPDTILAVLIRGKERMTPNGSSVLRAGDKLILSAKAPVETEGIWLTELQVDKDSGWAGKSISEIAMERGKLIVMVKRKDKIIIPKGDTVLEEDDMLVINQAQ